MGEIRYLENRGLLKDESIRRIVAAAKANAGLWLMVKERAVEKRAIEAELERQGADANVPTLLTPTIAELACELVCTMFGNCPPEIGSRVQSALLEAAESEINGGSPRL
ncbi:hypothetical protein BS627_03510 [Agrobacterium salinitolerans]|uniref:hypothetical protein n=1 Tax=Agrobacterium salinitolerans TaxID=1183413 RepID=UPI00098E932E|nr:hypothetical protein [Agrobacterium salinitolerans]OOO27791.1 hypothetical protein BS627_03510 [Agrobacterium salinitolerans]PNQ25692.1 hypothetical protein C2E26_03560 [Rhizobium sp. YIC5082]